jgi:hypothetical protein
MASWYEVPCGLQLFREFDTIAPNRSRASDGTIGDAAHQKEVSDHNPDKEGAVRAIDVTSTLNEPDLSMEDCVQFILTRCRAGLEKRITYIIYVRRIWAQDNEWRQVAYMGTSPHTEHAHFSLSHNDTLANNTASFHLEDTPMALTTADKTWITDLITSQHALIANAVAGKIHLDKITPASGLAQDDVKLEDTIINALKVVPPTA